jgi:hypothetical protein
MQIPQVVSPLLDLLRGQATAVVPDGGGDGMWRVGGVDCGPIGDEAGLLELGYLLFVVHISC